MKALLFLFGIYLLALGCLPCADSVCAGQSAIVALGTTHNKDCHGEETCPPFCTCACCSIHITSGNADLISLQPLQIVEESNLLSSLYKPLLSRVGNSIWQPPRLG